MFDLDWQLQVVHYPVSLAVSHSAWHDKVTVQTVQCVLYVYFPWDKYKKSHRNTDFIYYFLQFILIRNKSCKFMSDNLMNSKLNILLSGPCGASLLRVSIHWIHRCDWWLWRVVGWVLSTNFGFYELKCLVKNWKNGNGKKYIKLSFS